MNRHEQGVRPSAECVARRLSVLKFVVVYGLMTPPRDWLRQWFQSWSEEDRAGFARMAERIRDEFWEGVRAPD
jgi:hypothetical protein